MRSLLISGILILFLSTFAHAESLPMAWTPPETDAEGLPIEEPILYRMYWCEAPIADDATCTGELHTQEIAENATEAVITFPDTVRNIFFRMVAYTHRRLPSALSNEVEVLVVRLNPPHLLVVPLAPQVEN